MSHDLLKPCHIVRLFFKIKLKPGKILPSVVKNDLVLQAGQEMVGGFKEQRPPFYLFTAHQTLGKADGPDPGAVMDEQVPVAQGQEAVPARRTDQFSLLRP